MLARTPTTWSENLSPKSQVPSARPHGHGHTVTVTVTDAKMIYSVPKCSMIPSIQTVKLTTCRLCSSASESEPPNQSQAMAGATVYIPCPVKIAGVSLTES